MAKKSKTNPAPNSTELRNFVSPSALTQQYEEVDQRFGDGTPYDKIRVFARARLLAEQSASTLVELGKCLILLKEHEPHGEFLDAVDALGLAPRTAQRMMQVAVRLGPKAIALTYLGMTKSLELLVLDDEEIEQLGSGGTARGIHLDDIDRMTTRELRAHLRKDRKKLAAATETNATKIASLEQEVADLRYPGRPWLDRVYTLSVEIAARLTGAQESFAQFDTLREAILAEPPTEDLSEAGHPREMLASVYYHAINQLLAGAAELKIACDAAFGEFAALARSHEQVWTPEQLDRYVQLMDEAYAPSQPHPGGRKGR